MYAEETWVKCMSELQSNQFLYVEFWSMNIWLFALKEIDKLCQYNCLLRMQCVTIKKALMSNKQRVK